MKLAVAPLVDRTCDEAGCVTRIPVATVTREEGSSERLAECLESRAVEAMVWGMPLVRFDTLRQAFFRDARASYGDIAYWSKPADWNLQWPVPSASEFRAYFNFNTKDEPVVLDLPSTLASGL